MKTRLTLALCIALLFGTQCIAQTTWYVSPSGNDSSGSSWTNAYNDLQDAIDAATAGDAIWVAQGTYKPSRLPMGTNPSGTSNRDYSFHLNKNLEIYGGFSGTESLLSLRNYASNTTTLSGDIGLLNNTSDNCYNVLITTNLTSDAIIDGFHITRGNADGGFSWITYSGQNFFRSQGAGMHNISSSPTLMNNRFYDNSAAIEGGAMENKNSSVLTISNCDFYDNTANIGAAMSNVDFSSAIINNSRFYDNVATNHGGALYNYNCSPMIMNSDFHHNTASNNGGSIYNNFASVNINNSNFHDNEASYGGAIFSNQSHQ